MSDKHLSRQPRAAYENPHRGKQYDKAWWYEEPGGVLIVVEPHPTTKEVYIRWGQIESALKRKRAES